MAISVKKVKFDDSAVCMVVYNKYPLDTRVRRAAESLVKSGFSVHVICTSETGRSSHETVDQVLVHRLNVYKGTGPKLGNIFSMCMFMVLAAKKVYSLHRKFAPVFYHIHSLPDFLVLVALWPKLQGAGIVLDLHESLPEIVMSRFKTASPVVMRFSAALERMSCMLSDHVIVVNDTIKNLVINRGEKPERISVVMNSPMKFGGSGSENQMHPQVRSMQKSGDALFIYAGGINKERDLITLIDAVNLLKKDNIYLNVLLFTHTETAFSKILDQQINGLNLGNQIRFCGSLPPENVMPNLRASQLGIVTYEKNVLTDIALPNKVFEYIKAGCPLVVADLPTLRTVLGHSARYYSPGDPSSLSEAIRMTLSDPDSSERVKTAREIHQRFCWPIMEKRLLALYDDLKR